MVESKIFFYDSKLEWKGNKEGDLRAAALAPIVLGAPPEFNVREGTWSPEQLFVASVNGCFILTFLAIAENSKLPLLSYGRAARKVGKSSRRRLSNNRDCHQTDGRD